MFCAGCNLHGPERWPWPYFFSTTILFAMVQTISFLPNSTLSILLPTSHLARLQCFLHTAASLLSEMQLDQVSTPATLRYIPFVLSVQSTWVGRPFSHFCYYSPRAFYSPAVQTHRAPSSLVSLCLEYPLYSYLWTLFLEDFYLFFRAQLRHCLWEAFLPPGAWARWPPMLTRYLWTAALT